MNILITGATGLIGKALVELLKSSGHRVHQLTTRREMAVREGFYFWNPANGEVAEEAFSGVESIIHLAGSSIGAGRWSMARKKEITDSRTLSTALLYKTVEKLKLPLKSFVSASATGYYGGKTTETVYDEYSPEGNDFLASVCVEWEKAADLFRKAGIRTVKMRTGVVLGPGAPALAKMMLPIKLGVGSPLGNGRQYMPWIHLDDLCRMYVKAIEDETMSGAYNAVAPQHITNRELMKTLAVKLHKPFFFPPVPAFILKILLGEMAVIVTDGSRVTPRRFTAAGFKWKYSEVEILNVKF